MQSKCQYTMKLVGSLSNLTTFQSLSQIKNGTNEKLHVSVVEDFHGNLRFNTKGDC